MSDEPILKGRWLELGAGANPTPGCECRVDIRPIPGITSFTVDFCQFPWPISSDEWDGVVCKFVLEHIPYPLVLKFLQETLRITKPGGSVVFMVPNTEAQVEFILARDGAGYDGKSFFEAASCHLFGDLTNGPGGGQGIDYQADSHKAYFNSRIVLDLFKEAGFNEIHVQPFGERKTDFVVQAKKPDNPAMIHTTAEKAIQQDKERLEKNLIAAGLVEPPAASDLLRDITGLFPQATVAKIVDSVVESRKEGFELTKGAKTLLQAAAYVDPKLAAELKESFAEPIQSALTVVEDKPVAVVQNQEGKWQPAADPLPPRENIFDRDYFNKGKLGGGYAGMGYLDFPCHQRSADLVLARKPASVLELGCGRGYVLKRIQDAGIPSAWGSDISRHCFLTRACENVRVWDICKTPWEDNARNEIGGGLIDLCYSIAVLELIPEEFVPAVIGEMARTCKRGLHGIDFGPGNGVDKTKVCVRERGWWVEMFRKHAPGWPVELLPKDQLEAGPLSEEYLRGNPKELKLNVGCAWTMHHHGWLNLDVLDQKGFADAFGYAFRRLDVRNGLPYQTGSVDLINCQHMLEHITYDEGLCFLRDARRVLKPNGAMRLAVPDAHFLTGKYVVPGEFYGGLAEFDQLSETCAKAKTPAGKLQALLHDGHQACYDSETLRNMLTDSGFKAVHVKFRNAAFEQTKQIVRETLDMIPCLSLYYDVIPSIG